MFSSISLGVIFDPFGKEIISLSSSFETLLKLVPKNSVSKADATGSIVYSFVFIYFSDETKMEMLGRIVPRIKKEGYLILGHAESIKWSELERVQHSVYRVS